MGVVALIVKVIHTKNTAPASKITSSLARDLRAHYHPSLPISCRLGQQTKPSNQHYTLKNIRLPPASTLYFYEELQNRTINSCSDVNSLSLAIQGEIMVVAMLLHLTSSRINSIKQKPWYDKECFTLKKEWRRIRHLCIGEENENSIIFVKLKEAKVKYKNTCRHKREEFYNNVTIALNSSSYPNPPSG